MALESLCNMPHFEIRPYRIKAKNKVGYIKNPTSNICPWDLHELKMLITYMIYYGLFLPSMIVKFCMFLIYISGTFLQVGLIELQHQRCEFSKLIIEFGLDNLGRGLSPSNRCSTWLKTRTCCFFD